MLLSAKDACPVIGIIIPAEQRTFAWRTASSQCDDCHNGEQRCGHYNHHSQGLLRMPADSVRGHDNLMAGRV